MKQSLLLYTRLLGYAKPYWRVILVSLGAMLLIAALEPMLPALLKPLVDEGLVAKTAKAAWQVPLAIIGVFFAKGIADYLANISSQWVSQKAIADLRDELFSHQIRLDLHEHARQGPGVLTSRLTYDTSQVGAALSTAWLTVVRDSLIIIGLLGYLFYVSWALTSLVLLIAPLVAVAIHLASRSMRASNVRLQQYMAKLNGMISEALAGIREIKSFRAETNQTNSFSEISDQVRKENMRLTRIQSLNVPMVQMIAAFAVAAVIVLATQLSQQDLLSPGEFVSFIAAMSMVFEPVRRLTNVNAVIQRGLAAAASIFATLDMAPEVSDSAQTTLTRAKGVVKFEQVGFSYELDKPAAVESVSFEIHPGQMVALTGPSGGGKSSIAALLAGLYLPDSGLITLDGKTVQQWGLMAYRQQVSLVTQQVVLFDCTIAQNILVGRPEASAEEVRQAARRANISAFIDSLPEGFDTPLGSLGSKLSGGQRQRLAIARAFLKDAPVLVLDEATSALDKTNEDEVIDAIDALRTGRSVLVIAHRINTIESADEILVMEGGCCRARGKAAELRSRGLLA